MDACGTGMRGAASAVTMFSTAGEPMTAWRSRDTVTRYCPEELPLRVIR